jgi:hypothetical protein
VTDAATGVGALERMSQAELDETYRRSPSGDIPRDFVLRFPTDAQA